MHESCMEFVPMLGMSSRIDGPVLSNCPIAQTSEHLHLHKKLSCRVTNISAAWVQRV